MRWAVQLLLLVPFLPAYGGDFDLLPPNSRVVFGVHVRAVADSALARSLAANLESATADWQKMIAVVGFDPLRDIDEFLMASTGEGQDAPVLIVARGRFDAAHTASGELYHGVRMARGPDQSGAYAVLDAATLVAGDAAAVRAAIDRRKAPPNLNEKLAVRVADYRQRYEIWGIADQPQSLARRFAQSSEPQVWDSVDSFQIGVALRHGLEIAAEVHARSESDAGQLNASLLLLEAMLKSSRPELEKGANFTVEHHGNTLKLALAVPEEELKQAVTELRNMRPVASLAPPAASARPARPAPRPAPQGLRIQSSEGGAPAAPTSDPRSETAVFTLPSQK